MKKTLLTMIAVLLAVIGIFTAADHPYASQAEFLDDETFMMYGTISELRENSFLMLNTEGVLIEVSINERSVFDTDGALETGDVVGITYDGFMSRSIPSRINAMAVCSHRMHGTVTEVGENSFTLLSDAGNTVKVISDELPSTDVSIDLWYDGSMESGAIQAWQIRGLQLTGMITGVEEDTFVLDTGSEECVMKLTEATRLIAPIEVGASVRVAVGDVMTLSLPAIYEAKEILPVY